MSDEPLTDAELDAIEARAAAASPGPWRTDNPDDDVSMNVLAVITGTADIADLMGEPYEDHGRVVALTLLQSPRYACVADERWEENTAFIAAAREDVPRLVAEVRRLRGEVESLASYPPGGCDRCADEGGNCGGHGA